MRDAACSRSVSNAPRGRAGLLLVPYYTLALLGLAKNNKNDAYSRLRG